jgi:hypothetical protein
MVGPAIGPAIWREQFPSCWLVNNPRVGCWWCAWASSCCRLLFAACSMCAIHGTLVPVHGPSSCLEGAREKSCRTLSRNVLCCSNVIFSHASSYHRELEGAREKSCRTRTLLRNVLEEERNRRRGNRRTRRRRKRTRRRTKRRKRRRGGGRLRQTPCLGAPRVPRTQAEIRTNSYDCYYCDNYYATTTTPTTVLLQQQLLLRLLLPLLLLLLAETVVLFVLDGGAGGGGGVLVGVVVLVLTVVLVVVWWS